MGDNDRDELRFDSSRWRLRTQRNARSHASFLHGRNLCQTQFHPRFCLEASTLLASKLTGRHVARATSSRGKGCSGAARSSPSHNYP